MTYEEARKAVHNVEPFKWVNRNITVVAMGQCGMHDVCIVREPGYDGTDVCDGMIVFSERKEPENA